MGTDGEPIVRAPAMTLAAAEKEKGDGKRKADSQKKKKKKKVGSLSHHVAGADLCRREGSR